MRAVSLLMPVLLLACRPEHPIEQEPVAGPVVAAPAVAAAVAPSPTPATPAAEPVEAAAGAPGATFDGPLVKGPIKVAATIFMLLPVPDLERHARDILEKQMSAVRFGAAAEPGHPAGKVEVLLGDAAKPPTAQELATLSRDVDEPSAKRLSTPVAVVRLEVEGVEAGWLENLKRFQYAVLMLMLEGEAVTRDEATRELFGVTGWRDRRAGAWSALRPRLLRQTTRSVEVVDGRERSITRGLANFGMPDILVEGYAPAEGNAMAAFTAILAQALADRGKLDVAGRFLVDLDSLSDPDLTTVVAQRLSPGAERKVAVQLFDIRDTSGEWRNRVITPAAGADAAHVEPLADAVKHLFGEVLSRSDRSAERRKAAAAKDVAH